MRKEESTISAVLMNIHLLQGDHVIVKDVTGIKYPLKIVISVEKDTATVVTNYPLKKGKKK